MILNVEVSLIKKVLVKQKPAMQTFMLGLRRHFLIYSSNMDMRLILD